MSHANKTKASRTNRRGKVDLGLISPGPVMLAGSVLEALMADELKIGFELEGMVAMRTGSGRNSVELGEV
jgi:hypothetical protein